MGPHVQPVTHFSEWLPSVPEPQEPPFPAEIYRYPLYLFGTLTFRDLHVGFLTWTRTLMVHLIRPYFFSRDAFPRTLEIAATFNFRIPNEDYAQADLFIRYQYRSECLTMGLDTLKFGSIGVYLKLLRVNPFWSYKGLKNKKLHKIGKKWLVTQKGKRKLWSQLKKSALAQKRTKKQEGEKEIRTMHERERNWLLRTSCLDLDAILGDLSVNTEHSIRCIPILWHGEYS